MTDPFEASKHSIAWAKDGIAKLDREIKAFTKDKNAYEIFTERDADGTYDLLKFRLRKGMPRAIRGYASDAAINLRAALDQAVCTVAVLCGLPTHTTYFPIGKTQTDFDNTLKGRLGKMPQEIRDLVRRFKPYKGGNNTLWALRELSSTNKHGILRPVVLSSQAMDVSGTHRGRRLQFPFPPHWDSAKDEMVLIRAPITDGEFKVDYDFSFFIGFHEIEFIDGQPVVSVLNNFVSITESIVMAIEAECRRIGLL